MIRRLAFSPAHFIHAVFFNYRNATATPSMQYTMYKLLLHLTPRWPFISSSSSRKQPRANHQHRRQQAYTRSTRCGTRHLSSGKHVVEADISAIQAVLLVDLCDVFRVVEYDVYALFVCQLSSSSIIPFLLPPYHALRGIMLNS